MPHDMNGDELCVNDKVTFAGSRIGTVKAVDPNVCVCTVESRGQVYALPAAVLVRAA